MFLQEASPRNRVTYQLAHCIVKYYITHGTLVQEKKDLDALLKPSLYIILSLGFLVLSSMSYVLQAIKNLGMQIGSVMLLAFSSLTIRPFRYLLCLQFSTLIVKRQISSGVLGSFRFFVTWQLPYHYSVPP